MLSWLVNLIGELVGLVLIWLIVGVFFGVILEVFLGFGVVRLFNILKILLLLILGVCGVDEMFFLVLIFICD